METSVEGTLNREEYDRQQDGLTPCYPFQKETWPKSNSESVSLATESMNITCSLGAVLEETSVSPSPPHERA